MSDIDFSTYQVNWNYPTAIRFGVGCVQQLPELCRSLGMSKPLLVTDQGLASLPLIENMLSMNNQAGLPTEIFSDIKPNPTGTNISAGVLAYRQGQHDGVIAVGGGSGLDAAKAIALMAGQDRRLWDFEDIGDNWKRVNEAGVAPCIAIPTTAGTGSEVGRASVITDEDVHVKRIIFHPKMLPANVILDPQLTVGLPSALTAATGVDALSHCMEAFCAPGYHPMADGIAMEGMRLIKTWLPIAYDDGENLQARGNMLVASSMGATAFQKGLGGMHALAHPLGALYDAHHGLLNAVLMPYVLSANKEAIADKMSDLARCLSIQDTSLDGVLDWVLTMRKRLGIPHTLAEIGIDDKQLDLIAKMAVEDPSAGGNPIQFTIEQYRTICESAITGKL